MTRLLVLLALVFVLLAAGCGGDVDSSDTRGPSDPSADWIDLGDDVAVTVRTFEHEGRQITCVFSYDGYHGTSSGLDCPEWLNRR